MKSDKCGPTNLPDKHESKFSVKHLFLIFHYPTHSVLTFFYPETYFLFTSNFRNILFVYLVTGATGEGATGYDDDNEDGDGRQ